MIDHLVYAAPDLASAVEELEERLGVRATAGGAHPGRGTRNALIALGPRSYLEIVGPDPEQPNPASAPWIRIDHLAGPALVTWCAAARDVATLRRAAMMRGVALGEVVAGSRERPDGVVLSWQVTDPGVMLAGGLVPFFIDWGSSPHPALDAAPGVSLVSMRATSPDAEGLRRSLRVLGVDRDLTVAAGEESRLVAVLAGRRGRMELASR